MRAVAIVQDKGGSGKTTIARGVAEAVLHAPVVEVESESRLVELGDRVRHVPVRVSRDEIDRTGGRAARSEYDPAINHLFSPGPKIFDVGANAGGSLLSSVAQQLLEPPDSRLELAIVVVVTAEPASLAEGHKLLTIARAFANSIFVLENKMHGDVDANLLAALAGDALVLSLDEQILDPVAADLLKKAGLVSTRGLGKEETPAGATFKARLIDRYDVARATRIVRDLTRFRSAILTAVQPIAQWLDAP